MMNKSDNTFPNRYADIPLENLLTAYKEGPDRVRKSVEGLSGQDLKEQIIEDKWSIFEIVIHVADSELVGAVRLRQCYAQSDTRFPFYDQDIWADAFGYQEQSINQMADALDLFKSIRKTTYAILEKCKGKDWSKRGFHPEVGEITLRNVLELYSDHSERHLGQILQRRQLMGKPLDLPLILDERLY